MRSCWGRLTCCATRWRACHSLAMSHPPPRICRPFLALTSTGACCGSNHMVYEACHTDFVCGFCRRFLSAVFVCIHVVVMGCPRDPMTHRMITAAAHAAYSPADYTPPVPRRAYKSRQQLAHAAVT